MAGQCLLCLVHLAPRRLGVVFQRLLCRKDTLEREGVLVAGDHGLLHC